MEKHEILSVSGLSKRYGRIEALTDFTLTVNGGEVWGVLGPNGSGKTTLLSILLGVRFADRGTFSWFGQPYCCRINSRIGSLLEIPYLYPYLSVYRNLELTAVAKGCSVSEISRALDYVNLLDKAHVKAHSLSLGMKQRLAIAQAIMGNPSVLLLDEPTNGLDPKGIADIRNLIARQAAKGVTIVLASHNLAEVQRVCSHVVILDKGRAVAKGLVSDLLTLNRVAIICSTDSDRLTDYLEARSDCRVIDFTPERVVVSIHSLEVANALNNQLQEAGFTIDRFELRNPTLEEFFLDTIANRTKSGK